MGNTFSASPESQAESLVQASLDHPITIFSKRSCYYCHHTKKLIWNESQRLSAGGCEVPKPTVVELDDGSLPPETVIEVQRLLGKITGETTVPRVFVGGRSIGGAAETTRLATSGGLKVALASAARCSI